MVQTTSHIFSGKVEVESNLKVGSSHLFVDTENNRVGITTNDPHASLHVNGNAYVGTNFNVGTAIELNQVAGRVKATSFEGDGSLLSGVASTLNDVVNKGNVTSNTVQFTNTDTGIVTTGNVNVGNKLSVSSLSPGSVPYVNATNTLENSHITQSADTTSITSNLEVLGNVIIAGDSYAIDSQSLEVKDRIIGIAYDNILSGADTGILMEYPNRNVALVHHGASGNPYAQEFTIGYTQNTASDTTIINDTANVITVNVLGDLHTQNNMTVESGGSYFGDGTTLTGVALSSDMTSNASRISNLETSNTYLWSNLTNLSFDDVVNVNNATSNTVQFTNPTTALVTDLTSNVDIKLNQLSNVVITSPQTDQLLVYDGTDWVNEYNIHNFIKVHNTTGSTLYKGNVVYIVDSFNNNVSNVGLAKSDSSSTMPAIGLIHENISNGQEGSAVAYGKVQGIDTTGFTEGQTVYVSNTSAGNIMNIKPYGLTDQIQNVGICIKVHQNNGIVFVTGVGRSNDIPNALVVADETDINYVYVNNTNNDFKKIEPSNLLTQLQTLEQVVNTGNTVSNVINVTGLTTTANVEVGSNISIAGLTTNKFPIVGAGNVLEDSLISKANGTIVISSDVEILGNILVDGNSYTIDSNSLVINDRIIGIANNNVSHELDVGIIMQHPGKNIALIHHGEAQGDQDPHDHTFTIGYTQNTITDNHIFDDSNLITVEILGNLITQNNLTVTSGSYYGDGTTLTGVALSAELSDNASRISNLETSNDYIWSNISILENANSVQGGLITDLRTDLSDNASRISNLETSNDYIWSNISILENANNVQSGLITDLRTDLSDNASRISNLETSNDYIWSNISILENANNVQSGLITDLRTDVDANDGRLDLLEPRVTNLETSNEHIWSNLQSLTFDDVVNVNNATSNTVQFTNTGTSLIASGTVEAAVFKGSGAQLTNIPPSAITGTLSQWSDGANNDVYIASNVGIGNVHTLTSNTLQVGANLYVRDAGANVLTVHGNVVSTGKFLGDGTELTGVALESDLTANVIRISKLEDANTVQEGLITDLTSNLSSNASRISNLETSNDYIWSNISNLETSNDYIWSNISILENANNVQSGLITDLRTDLSDNASRISNLETSNDYIWSNISILENANNVQGGLITDLRTDVDANDGRITNLETDLAPIRTSTTGDIIYASATNTLNRLGIGSSGDVLSVSASGIPEWSSGGTGGVWSTNAEGEIYFTTSNVGIANADPGHELSVGSNLYVDDDGSNVLVVSGNISADALTLGDVAIVPSYGLDAVTTESNITNQVVQFNNPTTGFVTASNAVVGGTLSIENFEIVQSYGLENVTNVNNSTEDTIISTNVTTGFQSTANISVGRDAIISGNVSIGGIMTMGTVNVVARHSLQGVTDMGNTTTHTIQFTNPTTSLVATGNVEVGGTIHGYTKISASGGTESTTNAPGHKTHTFTSDGTFNVTTPGLVEYLVVAGGGGAPGRDIGGGGGGGGVKTGTLLIPAGTYMITVGAGGQGKYDMASDLSGMKGGNSSIGTFVESIGGGGGRDFNTDLPNNDYEGGSGGGGAGEAANGRLEPGFGILPQGNEGGRGEVNGQTTYGGGGGGGAGRRGKSAAEGRHGGDGIQSSISGTSTYYGGGGGGAGHRTSGNGTEGNGGLGGGGDCNQSTTTSDRNGTDGLGGGGGASRNTTLTGGSGGSGVVIIRYLS
jgi:uncharacterized protein YeeX (DUF496 family)